MAISKSCKRLKGSSREPVITDLTWDNIREYVPICESRRERGESQMRYAEGKPSTQEMKGGIYLLIKGRERDEHGDQ
jgi:hypothetical protein